MNTNYLYHQKPDIMHDDHLEFGLKQAKRKALYHLKINRNRKK